LHAAKERLIGLVEPCQYVLQDMALDRRVFRHGGADVLEFGFLLVP
jgi:hypothetical protein